MEAREDDPAADERIEQFFARFDALLVASANEALAWVDGASAEVRELDEWVLARCDALVAVQGTDSAARWLCSLLEEFPGFADAHHRLAELYEQLGDESRAVAQHLETLRLDLDADELGSVLSEETLAAMAEHAALTLAGLPERFRRRVGHVPVLLEARPSVELVRSGFDSRSLGLFSGASHVDEQKYDPSLEPTKITLYTHCLWDAFGLDEEELLEEVRITVLHEVGHFFGLSEDELTELGLD